MHGLMQNMPLMISSLIRHADRNHGDTESSRARPPAPSTATPTATHTAVRASSRARCSPSASRRATTWRRWPWNNHRHFELYYGVSGMGAILNTVNPRLFPEQIAYIINHAEDGHVFFDLTFLPLVEGVAPHCKGVKAWVALTDRAHMPESKLDLLCYEDLINAHSDDFEWPQFDETTASLAVLHLGHHGQPEGALYSHRSTVLHAWPGAARCAQPVGARHRAAGGAALPRQRLGPALCLRWPAPSW
ncbi:MAG: hypothetical protein M5R42_01995 [Rhodocyclaceae bacterium]|nr:hypothetical protein [Rhodocyclaceae bacterium]